MVQSHGVKNKLLIINSRFMDVGGGETYVLEIMDYFYNRGWEVHLATRTVKNQLTLWKGCHIHYIPGLDDNDIRLSHCLAPLKELLDAIKPCLVHVHNLMNFLAYSCVVKKGEYPAVMTIQDTPLPPERLFGRLGDYKTECRFAEELLNSGKCSKVTFFSRYYLDSYAQAAPILNNIGVVAYGFPAKMITDSTPGIKVKTDGNINVLFPSRIVKRKGIEECLRAFCALPKNYRLLLPGFGSCADTDYKQQIVGLIDELDLKDRVRTSRDTVRPEQMDNYYRMADVTVIPSHYEGLGLVALESMAWRVPVIAAGVGGLLEIITDGVDGMLVKPHKPEELAKSILELTSNQALREKIIKQASQTVRERFDRDKQMAQIEDIYRQALTPNLE